MSEDRLHDAAHSVNVAIVELAPGVLVRRAIAHYNARRPQGLPQATLQSREAFLKRICVNWLRHTGSHYDLHRTVIRRAGGSALSGTAGVLVKRRILVEIARVYPWLADEARRQYASLGEGAS